MAQSKEELQKTSNQKEENSLIEIVNQSGVELGVERVLMQNIALLPKNVMTDRIKASAGFYISNRDDLMKLDNKGKLEMLYGVLKEAMVGCEAGIDYDIVPFKSKPTIVRKKEGWWKIIDLIKPAEIIRFINNVVTTGDEFEFNPATEEIHHKLVGERGQKFENIEGAYAYIKFANGFEKAVYLSKWDLIQLKNISPSGKSEYSPWNSNAIRMVKAKITKELAKELFTLYSARVNSSLASVIESDEVSIKKIDKKGYIINDNEIYAEVKGPKIIEAEPVEKPAKEVNIDEL